MRPSRRVPPKDAKTIVKHCKQMVAGKISDPLNTDFLCFFDKMKQFLDWLGSPFVYRSPVGLQGFRAGLMQLSCKKLQPLADTKSHVKKSVLVDRIIADMK